jgi:serine/threonine protein kinase/predicted ATPase
MGPARGDQIGPYRLVAELGKGGMSVVWLAEHGESEERVALKTQASFEASTLIYLRREIGVLASLAHPSIATMFEHGVSRGVPWYSMELLHGRPLADQLRSPGPSRSTRPGSLADVTHELSPPRLLPAPQVEAPPVVSPQEMISAPEFDDDITQRLRWVADLCHALAYLHGEGVVHCDVKPDNIVLCDHGRRVVLVDFGLASRYGSRVDFETLTSAGLMAAGTANYIAPERINAHRFDARADLYSLGCILYEIVVGHVPFKAKFAAQVLVHQLSTPPTPPSSIGVQIPPALEQLILSLLAKDPDRRPGHAQAVLHVLEGLGISATPTKFVPKPRPYLFKSRIVGRSKTLAHLQKCLDRAAGKGEGSLTLIAGESGVGKTTLATEIIRQARNWRMEVFAGSSAHMDSSDPATRQAPLSAFIAILRRVADHCLSEGDPQVSDTIFGPRGALLAPIAPFIRDLPGQSEHTRVEPLPADLARVRLLHAVLDTLDAYSTAAPLLIILDDLQWADELSLSLIQHLADDGLRDRNWAVIGLYRPEESPPALRNIAQQPSVELVELPRLTPGDTSLMMAQMLGMEDVPEVLFAFVTRQSEGNPFFVAEYLQLAVAQGVLVRNDAGDWELAETPRTTDTLEEAGLPSSVQAVIDRRLSGISLEVWTWGEAAAVIGREIDPDFLLRVLDVVPAIGMRQAVTELQLHGIITETEEGLIRFTHDKFWRAAYDRIDPERRARLHGRVARLLQARPLWEAQLGWHWQQAGETELAVDAWLESARAAAAAYAYSLAEGRVANALALLEEDDPRARVGWKILVDQVLVVQGEFERAMEILERLLKDDPTDGAVGCRLGQVLLETGLIDQAIDVLDEARIAYRRAMDQAGEAEVLHFLARCHHSQGRWDDAMRYYMHTLELSRWLEDRPAQAKTMQSIASLQRNCGEHDRALDLLERALDIYREGDDTRAQALVMVDRARVYRAQGRGDDASPLLRSALRMLRRVGDRPGEADALNEIARIHRRQQNLDRAQVLFQTALDIQAEVGDRLGAASTTAQLATILRDRGEFDEAQRHYLEALEMAATSGGPTGNTQQQLAELYRRVGDFSRAMLLAEKALEAHSTLGAVGRQAAAYALVGSVHLSSGRLPEADEAFEAALERNIRSGHRPAQVRNLLSRAEVACDAEDSERASRLLNSAHAVILDAGETRRTPMLNALRGRVCLLRAEPGADAHFQLAVRGAAEIKDARTEALASYWWARDKATLPVERRRELLERAVDRFNSCGHPHDATVAKEALGSL